MTVINQSEVIKIFPLLGTYCPIKTYVRAHHITYASMRLKCNKKKWSNNGNNIKNVKNEAMTCVEPSMKYM